MRFTIRDLMWLVLVAALATCWFIERRATNALYDRVTALEVKLTIAEEDIQKLTKMREVDYVLANQKAREIEDRMRQFRKLDSK